MPPLLSGMTTPSSSSAVERTIADRERTSSDSTHPVSSSVGNFGAGGLPDRYEVVQTLGAGATGRVLAAKDHTFDREVAVKVLLGADGLATARFIREARITAALEHPNIVPVYDLEFTATGGVFFTMRKVEGISLGDALRRLKDGQPPAQVTSINDRLNLLLKVCDALSKAHDQRVVHQDIKPDNIMLGNHGEVLLVDWGEARVLDESHGSAGARVVGTPAYMSPEQARGERADIRSDIYGLGTTLFHALYLRHPLSDDHPDRFWRRKREGAIDPPTGAERSQVPNRLQAILRKAMAPAADERYQTVAGLADDLRAFQAGQAVVAYREGPLERLWRVVQSHQRQVFVSAAFVVVALLSVWTVWGERMKEMAQWGAPALVETFDLTWGDRWQEMAPGMFRPVAGGLVSDGPTEWMAVLWKQPIHGAAAVEFTATLEAGGVGGDLGVVWVSGDAMPLWSELQVDSGRRAFDLQVAGFFNTTAVIAGMPGRKAVASRPLTLESGRPYRVRIEIDNERLSMDLDGRRLLDHREPIPLGPGYLGFRTRFGGKQISDVRIYLKGVAEKVSILAIGDAAVQAGQPLLAANAYRRVAESHRGTALGEEARWREGLAREMSGDEAGAKAAWERIQDPAIHPRVLARQVAAALLRDEEAAWGAFADLYQRHPEVRQSLRDAWASWVAHYTSEPPVPTPNRRRAYEVKTSLFPDDTTTDTPACRLLYWMRDFDAVVTRHPEEKRWVAYSLIHLGRFAEGEAVIPGLYTADVDVRWSLGQFEQVAGSPRYTTANRIQALLRLDRLDEARQLAGSRPTPDLLLAEGRAAEVLQHPESNRYQVNTALWLLDRTPEAMAAMAPGARAGGAPYGLLISDDPTTALRNRRPQTEASALLLLAVIRGDRSAEQDARQRLTGAPLDYGYDIYWFEELVLPAVVDRLRGQAAALQELDRQAQGPWKDLWTGQLEAVTGYLTGRLDDAAFLAQPSRRDGRVGCPW